MGGAPSAAEQVLEWEIPEGRSFRRGLEHKRWDGEQAATRSRHLVEGKGEMWDLITTFATVS